MCTVHASAATAILLRWSVPTHKNGKKQENFKGKVVRITFWLKDFQSKSQLKKHSAQNDKCVGLYYSYTVTSWSEIHSKKLVKECYLMAKM